MKKTPLCLNLLPSELAPVHSLRANPNMTIKSADRCVAGVVWITDLYLAAARHLRHHLILPFGSLIIHQAIVTQFLCVHHICSTDETFHRHGFMNHNLPSSKANDRISSLDPSGLIHSYSWSSLFTHQPPHSPNHSTQFLPRSKRFHHKASSLLHFTFLL